MSQKVLHGTNLTKRSNTDWSAASAEGGQGNKEKKLKKQKIIKMQKRTKMYPF